MFDELARDVILGRISHFDLAERFRELGFQVSEDPENEERSEISFKGHPVGEILGHPEPLLRFYENRHRSG